MDQWKWISAALGSLLLWGTFALLRRYVPSRRSETMHAGPPLTEREYQKSQILFLILFTACGVLVALLLYNGYQSLMGSWSRDLPQGATLILPDRWSWYTGIGFAALGGGGFLGYFLMNALMEARTSLFVEESSRRIGFDTRKVFWGLYGLIVLISVAILAPLSRTWVRIETGRVVLHSFLSKNTRIYPLREVVSVYFARFYRNRQGEIRQRSHYRIHFADGREWTTMDFPYGIEDPSSYAEAFDRLTERVAVASEPTPEE